jgi:hypothetical protein
MEAIEQYREFKKTRRIFRTEAQKLDKLFDFFEGQTTRENRSKMGYYEHK